MWLGCLNIVSGFDCTKSISTKGSINSSGVGSSVCPCPSGRGIHDFISTATYLVVSLVYMLCEIIMLDTIWIGVSEV